MLEPQVCFQWINDLLVADFCGTPAWAGSINADRLGPGTCASC
jgi:hypothetical protein